jgi:hypothetical protein
MLILLRDLTIFPHGWGGLLGIAMISVSVQPLSKVEETTEVMKEPFVFKFPQWQLV